MIISATVNRYYNERVNRAENREYSSKTQDKIQHENFKIIK